MNPVFKAIISSLIGNTILIILKFAVGIATNTVTLIAAGIQSLADLITDVVSFVGQKACMKRSNAKHPRGYGRIEYITSIIIGIGIIMVSISLITDAFNSPVNEMDNNILFVVLISIVAKYFIAKNTYNIGIKYNNNILISGGLESRADFLSSIAVLITLLLSNLTPYIPILKYSDKIGTIVVSLFIFKAGFLILKDNLSLIIGEKERNEVVLNKVREEICKSEEIKRIDEVTLIKYGSYYDAFIRISLDENLKLIEAHEISKKVKHRLLKSHLKIKYAIIHINPYEEDK